MLSSRFRSRVAIAVLLGAAGCARGVAPNDGAPAPDVAPPTDAGIGTDAHAAGPGAHRGSEIVSSGGTLHSPHFQMVFTLGQSTTNQAPVHSPTQQVRGGFVGTTGGNH